MTQSGQGEEPSRHAREGIVLPSDGGEPLLPGMTGGRADPQHPGGQPGQQPPAAPPMGGQTWGQPWGPDRHQDPAPPPGQGWGTPQAPQPSQTPQTSQTSQAPQTPRAPRDQQWTAPEQQGPPQWGTPDPAGALPAETAPESGYGTSGYGTNAYGTSGYGTDAHGANAHGTDAYGTGSYGTDAYGTDAYGARSPSYGDRPAYPSEPLPAAIPRTGADPYGQRSADVNGFPSAALPEAGEGATQYIPPITTPAEAPVRLPADEGATQFLPPVPAAADEGATQFLPPVPPGALPPERPAQAHYPAQPQQGAGPMPSASHPDAEPTQYLPPVPAQGGGPASYDVRPGEPGERQPPSEFDNLFRTGPGAEAPAGATQQMPRVQQPPQPTGHGADPAYAQPSYAPPGPGGGRRGGAAGDGGRGGRRGGSRVPLIAGVGIAIVVVGVGAGALLSGGGAKSDDSSTVSASATASGGTTSSGGNAAKDQAVALDKLLADSGSSRAAVIRAVGNVKACNDLDGSAADLRDAARQRAELVTRLSKLTVDKLADSAALTSALNSAWKASAAADNHYAAWADQASGKRGCKKGQARVTGQTAAGNRESGTASNQKSKAAALWNTIAGKYGLTQRQPTQL